MLYVLANCVPSLTKLWVIALLPTVLSPEALEQRTDASRRSQPTDNYVVLLTNKDTLRSEHQRRHADDVLYLPRFYDNFGVRYIEWAIP